jgi:putative transposase
MRAQSAVEETDVAAQRWRILRQHVEDGIALTVLAIHEDVSLRSLQRWHAAYRLDGLNGLIPRPRQPRARKTGAEMIALIEGLALLKPALSTTNIARRANEAATTRGWPTVSYGTARSIVTRLDPGMRMLALEGPAKYRDKYELVWRHRAERPNALWQADHTELDIVVLDGNGRAARPWLTTIMDDYSRAICGYTIFLGAPSAMNTALALRQAIWPKIDGTWPMCGIPDAIYVDHGSDFTSNHIAQTAKDLHFGITYSTVARPQGRGKIERFFGTINSELLGSLPGHMSPRTTPRATLSLKELDLEVLAFITSNYPSRRHPEIDATPWAAWTSDGWLPRLPASIDELNLLLMTVAKTRTVQRDGIHFQGQRYVSPLLAAYVGENVVIRYDPADIAEIRIFHRNQYICKAIDQVHGGSNLTLRDIQAARSARRRTLRKQINERIAVASAYIHHPATRKPLADQNAETQSNPGRSKLRTYLEDN